MNSKFIYMIKEVWNIIKKYPILLAGTIIFMLLSHLLSIFISIFNKQVFDKVFYERDINYLTNRMIIVLCILFLLMLLISIFDKYFTYKLYTSVKIDKYQMFYRKVIFSSYYYFSNRSVSDIFYRMFSDINTYQKFTLDLLLNVPVKIIYSVISFIIIFTWSPVLTLTFTGFMVLKVLCISLTKNQRYKIAGQAKSKEQEIVKLVNEYLQKVFTVKIFGLENDICDKMNYNFKDYGNTEIRCNFTLSILNICSNFFGNIWSIVAIILGAILVYKSKLSVGEFIVFSSMASSLSSAITGMLEFIFQYPQAKVSYLRYKEYVQEKNMLEYGGSIKIDKDTKFNNLSAENIEFCYPNNKHSLFQNLNLHVGCKEIIKITGANGKGKTTLVNIVMRLIALNKKKIFIDKYNIFDIDYDSYRKYVAYCPQIIDIFNRDLFYNLDLGRENIDTEQMIYFIKELCLMDNIEDIDLKLNMIIGDENYRLSAGNIQKIGIIRVLASNSKIWIFDEPTSNLDYASKIKFIQLIRKIKAERDIIVLIISHDKEINCLATVNLNLDEW